MSDRNDKKYQRVKVTFSAHAQPRLCFMFLICERELLQERTQRNI